METTYSKSSELDSKVGTLSDIEVGESVEDWSLRIVDMLEIENVEVIEYWLDDSEKGISMCGCWSCRTSGYKLKVTTTSDAERMREFGFE